MNPYIENSLWTLSKGYDPEICFKEPYGCNHETRCCEAFPCNIYRCSCPIANSWLRDTSKKMAGNQLIQSLFKKNKIQPQERYIWTYVSIILQLYLVSIKVFVQTSILILTAWSLDQLDSPWVNFVGWIGGWALSSCPPLLGCLHKFVVGSRSLWAYQPHTVCWDCPWTIPWNSITQCK